MRHSAIIFMSLQDRDADTSKLTWLLYACTSHLDSAGESLLFMHCIVAKPDIAVESNCFSRRRRQRQRFDQEDGRKHLQ